MLRVFRTVTEQGSLAGAGEALGRTPSAISMMLSQLEADIGAPLFETDRKNRLTPLGQMVLEESTRATNAFNRSVEAIQRHASSLAGTVRIAAVPSATVTVLPVVIAAFRTERPRVRLEISDMDSQAVRSRVLLDEADIGILSTAVGASSDGVPILQDHLGIVCRADGRIAARAGQDGRPSWSLLSLEPLISNPLCDLVPNEAVSDALKTCNLDARNTTALLSFVRAGLGATILPRSAVWPQYGDLKFIEPTDPPARRELRKIAKHDRRFSPAAETFWEAF